MTKKNSEADLAIGRRFAELLRQYLDATPGLTPAGLAVKAGLDNTSVRAILTGKAKVPQLATCVRIAEALGMTLEEFMAGPRSQVERDILALVSRMPVAERLQLLGFAKALDAYQPPAPPEPPSEN